MFFSLLFSHTWQRKASCYCPAIEEALFDYSQPASYQALEHNYAFLWNIPFHNQTQDFQLIKNCSADQGVTHVVAWQCLKPRQPFFFFFFLCWPAVNGLWLTGEVGCPGYGSVQLHTVYKQSWDISGFQFLLDMSVLFALIKIPISLVPPHNSLLYLYCPDHIPV